MSYSFNRFLSDGTTTDNNATTSIPATTVTSSNGVNIDAFIVTTINSIEDLKSNTQYITSISNETIIDHSVNTDDIKCNNVFNKQGTTMIDLTNANDINISATNLTFNHDNNVYNGRNVDTCDISFDCCRDEYTKYENR